MVATATVKRRKKVLSSITGLTVRSNSYHLAKLVKGVRINHVLGRCQEIDLEVAEQQARELIKNVRDQGELALERFTATPAQLRLGHNKQSVKDVAFECLEHGKTLGTKKTGSKPWRPHQVKWWETTLKQPRLQRILSMPIEDVTAEDVLSWYREDLKNGKPSATDNARRIVSRTFNWAIGLQYIESNPCDVMQKSEIAYTPPARETRVNYQTQELGKYVLELATYQPKMPKPNDQTTKDLLVMVLITGLRAGSVRNLEWEWVNFDDRSIIVPAEWESNYAPKELFGGTKGRRDFWLPLPRILVTMLRTRYENRETLASQQKGDSALHFVFPNRYGTGSIQDVRKTQDNICELAGIGHKTIHDMRRTFTDLTTEVTDNFIEQKRLMDHKVADITATYMGPGDRPKTRSMFQGISDRLSQRMPVTINGDLYTGLQDLDENNLEMIDKRGFSPEAFEKFLYNPIWRANRWEHHEGAEEEIVPSQNLWIEKKLLSQ